MPHDITTRVVRNHNLGHDHYLLEFHAPEIAAAMTPAQFLMIGIPGSQALLRRPYSVCGLPGTFEERPAQALQVLYKVVGKGTALLAALNTGARITVLGPLGYGFTPPSAPETRPLFVAGGIGSAPFPALSASLRGRGRRPLMFYGARSTGELALLDWFRERMEEVVVTTEDGSSGRAGRVTEPLGELLAREDPSGLHVYACGPEPMLRAVARLALDRGVTCDLSLEAHMACGFGVCLGCVVPTHAADGGVDYRRLCVDGPVMRADRLAW